MTGWLRCTLPCPHRGLFSSRYVRYTLCRVLIDALSFLCSFHQVPYGFQQLTLGAGWIRILHYWVLVIAALFCLWLSLYWFGTKRHAEMVEKYKDVLVNEMTNEIRQDISSLSRKIIWFEVTAIMLTAVVVFLWMWQYDSACNLGCVGPYKDECH